MGRSIPIMSCIVALLFIQGCRPDEQGPAKFYEPGVYLGEADEPLDKETLDALRSRAMMQKSP